MNQSKFKKSFLTFLLGMSIVSAVLIFFCPKVMAAPAEEEEVQEEEEVISIPTLNAAVSDGALTVNAVSDKGIKSIYINGYEFRNSGNGNLKIKLQQFDTGYSKFYIYAEDNEGNTSELYEVENPYYDADPTDDEHPGEELPIDASPTDPSEAVGTVAEHLFSGGREFYQIETINGKTFYLIVDMLTDEEKVYFLTEISERDLMNVTSDTSETLPRNSAIPEDSIPDNGQAVANNNAEPSTFEKVFGSKKENTQAEVTNGKKTDTSKIGEEGEESMEAVSKVANSGSAFIYIVMGVICVAVIVIVSASKKKKRGKKNDEAQTNVEAVESEEE